MYIYIYIFFFSLSLSISLYLSASMAHSNTKYYTGFFQNLVGHLQLQPLLCGVPVLADGDHGS